MSHTVGYFSNTVPIHGASHIAYALPPLQSFHMSVMPYMWTVSINIGIMLSMYKYRRYTILGHILITIGIVIITLLSSFPMLLKDSTASIYPNVRIHKIIGVAVIATIFLQVLLGVLSKLLNLCKIPSLVLFYMNKAHLVLGYSITILCKFQVYYLMDTTSTLFWVLLVQDIIFALLIIVRKFVFPTLQQIIQPKYQDIEQIKCISSLTQLTSLSKSQQNQQLVEKEPQDYCIFSNYIFNLKHLKLTHPAGYQVVQLVKNRQIDRFIYGMYRPEKMPSLPPNSHTAKSMALLGDPIALIKIPNPYQGMPNEPFQVSIAKISSVSFNSHIYQIYITTKEPLQFYGYSSVYQLGRYYSLTINDKVTRLYTSVNFLHISNIRLLRKLGLVSVDQPEIMTEHLQIKKTEVQLCINTERVLKERGSSNQMIPLLLKVYKNGTLPNMLINHKADCLKLSPPKGLGLRLAELEKGTILILAGGTGLYPFSDIIDLLYKNYKLTTSPHLKEFIYSGNSILRNNPFAKFNFKLLFSCQRIQDIHPITLQQISQLNNSKIFSCEMRVKQTPSDKNLNIKFFSQSFENVLDSELANIKELAKIWLCGPPKMSEVLCQYIQKVYPDKDILMLI